MFKKIMWATDRSPTTERVLPLAKELSESNGAKRGSQDGADLAREAGADLIVLGSHGKGPLAGVFLGSFAL